MKCVSKRSITPQRLFAELEHAELQHAELQLRKGPLF